MGKEADLSQPAKAPTHTGDHGGATTPFFQDTGRVLGRRGGKSRSPSPHHCSTTNTINQGKGAGGDLGGGWGRGVPCGSGSQTTGKPSSGGSLPRSQESNTNSGCRRKEGRAEQGLAVGKRRSEKREPSLLAGGGFCTDEFSVRWNTSSPWQRGGSQHGCVGVGTCWAGSTHRSRRRPCRAPLALAAERLVKMALPLPGTHPAPGERMAQARRRHMCQNSRRELSVQRLWLAVSL